MKLDFSDSTGAPLRDYFAATAMQGSLSNSDAVTDIPAFAKWCYKMADAMLTAREMQAHRMDSSE